MQISNNKENNEMKVLYQIIEEVLAKYELFDYNYILEGIELVGIKNLRFWLDIVKQIDEKGKKEKTGLDNLPLYVLQMKKIPRKYLLEGIEKLESNDLYFFENLIYGLGDYFDFESKSF